MKTFKVRTHFKEASPPQAKNGSKFQVVLIQEGLGNLGDCFYYTKECLQKSGPIFEGKKCYADHPSSFEENVRPERSTRDVLGYYQNVQYNESGDGRGQLVADLITVVDPNLSWAQALLSTSLTYAQSYTDSDFVGLSINASGEADETSLAAFLQQNEIPPSVMPKLAEAQTQGIDTIRVVSVLKDAISCDLVTDAGAGGRILNMIEQEKKPMKKETEKKEKKESETEKKEAGINPKDNLAEAGIDPKNNLSEAGEDGTGMNPPGADGATPTHADADQDIALFKQLIAQYLGGEDGQGAEGVNHEDAMMMAKHAYEASREAGMDHEASMHQAGNHIKMAHEVGKRMSQCKQSEAFPGGKPPAHAAPAPAASGHAAAAPVPPGNPEAMPKKQIEKYYEAMRKDILRLNAENFKLKESLNKFELIGHIEKRMTEKKYPSALTKRFRESLGPVKSKEEIDRYWKYFLAARGDESSEEVAGYSDCLMLEKGSRSSGAEGSSGFGDCL